MDVGLGRLLMFVREGGILPAHAANSKSDPHGLYFEGGSILRSVYRRHVFASLLKQKHLTNSVSTSFRGTVFYFAEISFKGFYAFRAFPILRGPQSYGTGDQDRS